ncbi:MAG: hypothetical protein JHC34_06935 [Acidobacteria bacterium]|nr:hypothetical protein [Acidobacteriota bacterium]
MDERLKSVAQGALRILGARSPDAVPPNGGGRACSNCGVTRSGGELRISSITLAQLSHLAYLQAGEPLVDEVIEALRAGRPVHLDRPAVEAALDLGSYPPRMQETFARWFVRISGFGVHLAQAPAPPPINREGAFAEAASLPAAESPVSGAAQAAPAFPEKAVLSEILGGACTPGAPCVLEPGKPCTGTGRCKEFGY